jgi:zinc protease
VTIDRSRIPSPARPPVVRFPIPEKHSLGRTRVWSVAHRDLPVVVLIWMIPVGSASDPADRAGLATFVADLLDEGSGGRTMLEVNEQLARMGAQLDTEVGVDATMLTLVSLSRTARDALALLAEVVCRPNLAQGEIARVRSLRLNRIRQMRSVPGALADRAFYKQLYGSHPYGQPPLGTEETLERIDQTELHGFHRERLLGVAPTLVLIGDLPSDGLRETARGILPSDFTGSRQTDEPWPRLPSIDELPGQANGNRGAARLVLVPRPGAAQSELRVGALTADRTTPDYHPLVVTNAAVGGAFVSRLNLNLRERRGFTYGVRSSVQFWRAPGPFVVQTSVQTDATAASIAEILKELADVGGPRPVDAREIVRARDSLTRGFARSFETAEQIARAATQLVLYDLPDSWYDDFVPRVEAVEPEEVTRIAREYLDPGRMYVTVVADPDRVGDLAKLGLGDPILAEPF